MINDLAEKYHAKICEYFLGHDPSLLFPITNKISIKELPPFTSQFICNFENYLKNQI
jgi:hypothetical protein